MLNLLKIWLGLIVFAIFLFFVFHICDASARWTQPRVRAATQKAQNGQPSASI
jgi:hypothetical protein